MFHETINNIDLEKRGSIKFIWKVYLIKDNFYKALEWREVNEGSG